MFLLVSSLARAGSTPEPLPERGFEIRSPGVVARVRSITRPAPAELPPNRICAFHLKIDAGLASLTRDSSCSGAVATEVDEALAAWKVDVEGGTGPVDLTELWFVFTQAGQPAQIQVVPAAGRDLVVRTPSIDVLPWSLLAQAPVDYPDDVGPDTVSNTCRARIGVPASGVPETVAITLCDPVFAKALAQGLNRWRFGGATEATGPTALVVEARFVRDGALRDVEVALPSDADLGDRPPPAVAQAEAWKPPPPPTGPPLFVVDHKSFAQVKVFGTTWPAVGAASVERRCDLLWQVNSSRRVWSWSETCDASVREASEKAAAQWVLEAGTIERGERMARFRGTFVFFPGETSPVLWLPIDDLVSAERTLPENVHTQRAAKAIVTVPPKLPRNFRLPTETEIVCDYVVRVDRSGKPREVSLSEGGCPDDIASYMLQAVKKWRWVPAEVDGQPVETQVVARLRVDVPAESS